MGSYDHAVPRSANVGVSTRSDPPARKPEPARSLWRWLPALFAEAPDRDSRQILADQYITEARVAQRLAQHAERVRGYPDGNGHSMGGSGDGPRVMVKGIESRRVGEVMRPPRATASPRLRVHELKAMFELNDAGTLPVVDDQGVLRGVVGILDPFKTVRPARSSWFPDVRALWGRRVEDIMTRGVMTVGPNETVDSAVQLMVGYQLESVPVVDGRRRAPRLAGTVAARDLLRSRSVILAHERLAPLSAAGSGPETARVRGLRPCIGSTA
jgi:CBS domain-containing protein